MAVAAYAVDRMLRAAFSRERHRQTAETSDVEQVHRAEGH
jgi:hypothetical protein